jgi:fluoroacetyl-CoA thioesterase
VAEGLVKGVSLTKKFVVREEHSAKHLGSGDVAVLSTPSMILFMENTALELAQRYLPEGKTTVGIGVDVRHLRAAPVGAEIEVRAELLSVDGKRLVFWVEAWWGDKKIGHGLHERAIVDREEFLQKVKN